MNKPLHKDLSFWIVAVVLVVAANLTQLYFAVPWFAGKIVQMRHAPRITPQARSSVVSYTQPTNPSHKPEEWQLPYSEPGVLETAPPQVTIVPTKFPLPTGGWSGDTPPAGGWSMMRGDKVIGIRSAPQYLLLSAYRWNSRARMLLPPDMPTEQYDFIANLPTGALEALQEEIKKKLGLVAERETIQTNVLVLRVDHTDAPGLKPAGAPPAQQNQPNVFHLPSAPISVVVNILEQLLQTPLIDQTGLTGAYDIQFSIPQLARSGQPADRIEQFKPVLKEQLGLALIETNAPIEMLVVKKVN